MNLLLNTGPIVPKPGNNVILLMKLLPYLAKDNSLRILSSPGQVRVNSLISEFQSIPTVWGAIHGSGMRNFFESALAKIIDANGYSDYIGAKRLTSAFYSLRDSFPVDAVLSTMEPFPAADAAARILCKKRILYLMDPPACVFNGQSTLYRDRRLKKTLDAHDAVFTTPFIRQALTEGGFARFDNKIISVGFPLIEQHDFKCSTVSDDSIRLLFCGWLYSGIRSPKYFLDILSRLDERFIVTFMGRECEKLTERFDIHTKAELISLPQQPYETALQAMADADILINIGNSVPVHMPSKTLEYINTGKPIVNIYKMEDCPTLYYTKRYPLCLNLSEKDPDLDAAAARFTQFCVTSRGKTVDRQLVLREYAECTPAYIANQILQALKSN